MTLPLEKQVSSLESSMKLKELGVLQESLYSYIQWDSDEEVRLHTALEVVLSGVETKPVWTVAAYTVAELGEMLRFGKKTLIPVSLGGFWTMPSHQTADGIVLGHVDEMIEADARAAAVSYLIENGLLDPKTLSV